MAKLRQDSWATRLTEEQAWKLYYRARGAQWQDAVKWASDEFALAEVPSRSAFYRWLKFMRGLEHAHRMEQAAVAAAEAAALGRTCTKDEALIAAFKSLATETALSSGNAKDAVSFVNAAMAIKDRLLHDQKIALEARAQATKDEQLKLAREKFEAAEKRLDAAAKTVTDETLTDEERVAKVKSIFGIN